jgi:hypothetical protein
LNAATAPGLAERHRSNAAAASGRDRRKRKSRPDSE